MFIGEYQHTIDKKGRIIVPAKFRDSLGDVFIVTKGLDGCLFAYNTSDWAKFEKKITELPVTSADSRKFSRYFFSGACECELDSMGRVVLPANLREHANLSKNIVSIGVSNRVEIWDKERWDVYNGEENFVDDELAAKMAELGV